MPVPIEEASRFGIVITDEDGRITEFQEKLSAAKEQSGVYGHLYFSWPAIEGSACGIEGRAKSATLLNIIPYCHEKNEIICL